MNYRKVITIIAFLMLITTSTSCLSISAVFNSKAIFKKNWHRSTINSVAAITDLALLGSSAGRLGNHIIDHNVGIEARSNTKDAFAYVMITVGWQLLIAGDYLLAAIIRKIIWNESLFEDLRLFGISSNKTVAPEIARWGPSARCVQFW